MRFTKPAMVHVDPEKRKAVCEWVFEELRSDIAKNGDRIDCLVYCTATRSETAVGTRYAVQSKTGGIDEVKPLLALHIVQGLRGTAEKTGNYDFLAVLPFWHRLAFRLLCALPML